MKNLIAKKEYCIVGSGGFGRETLTWLKDSSAAFSGGGDDGYCFLEDPGYGREPIIMGIPVVTSESMLNDDCLFVVAINDPQLREKITMSLPARIQFGRVIHPSAVISDQTLIGEGSVIGPFVSVSCNTNIGLHANINPQSTIAHDCNIGNYFTSAPGANISGNCNIGNRVYFGSNSVIKQGLRVCDDVIIGMGAVVINSISEPGAYIGNPAKKINQKVREK
jgi:sugar O-acyltransferase (sialic acid O-acetyltransferase NeuD family)